MAIIKAAPNPGPALPYSTRLQANLKTFTITQPSTFLALPTRTLDAFCVLAFHPELHIPDFLPISSFNYNQPQSNHGHFRQEPVYSTTLALLWN